VASQILVVTKVRQLVTFSDDVVTVEDAVKAAEANITLGTDSELGDDSQGFNQSKVGPSKVYSAAPWNNQFGDRSHKQITTFGAD
jgi:hypothetical protein